MLGIVTCYHSQLLHLQSLTSGTIFYRRYNSVHLFDRHYNLCLSTKLRHIENVKSTKKKSLVVEVKFEPKYDGAKWRLAQCKRVRHMIAYLQDIS